MNAQDLRNLLEQTDNKLSIFANKETFNKYKINKKELCKLIRDFLSDEEKLKLFDYSHFRQFNSNVRSGIIGVISDENIILQIINNDTIMKEIENDQIVDIFKEMSDSAKKQLLHNQDFLEKHQMGYYELRDIISSLTEKSKIELLMNKELIINKLHLEDFQIVQIAKDLSNEETKGKLLETYEFINSQKIEILNTCSNKYKLNSIFKENEFNKLEMISILKTLDINTLSEFLIEQKEFCNKNKIAPYEIICKLDVEQQKEFVENLEKLNLTLSEKKEVLATLKPEAKQSIDATNFPEEYKIAISMQTEEFSGKIIVDLERNLEDYRGLDKLIYINPEEFIEEQRIKVIKLCDICPNLKVFNNMNIDIPFDSNGTEYKEAEEWINSIIDNLNPEYSKAQKMAIIDNAIGKKISYSPDFDTEVFDSSSSRALWKIISSGYGVCNGIANVEQYMLNRVGIESEIISSGTHAFLKIKDIELPLANGTIAKGNTILDPTWNLTRHRFGGIPDNFCINYEQSRKNDVDIEGKDHNCHKNDEQLQDATLNLDEQSLRNLFKSIGLADKEGQFPLKDIIKESKQIDKVNANQLEQNIKEQFLLLKKICPEFAKCQDSSMCILSDVLLNNENMNFEKCAINRVYEKTDKEKRPIMFVYIDSNEIGKKFYFANKEEGNFIGLSQEEFTKKFECYEQDLNKNNRIKTMGN